MAWHVEALQRQKRLPQLQTLLMGSGITAVTPRKQSVKKQRQMLQLLSEAYGGAVTTTKPGQSGG